MSAKSQDARPLGGQRVMLTRPRVEFFRRAADDARRDRDDLVEELSALGAEVLLHPVIKISAPLDWRPVDNALARLAEFDWLVFSSVNGVRFFLERLYNLPHLTRKLT
ncbi:MAG: uroporphyrinogen-III synthase, partial [Thermoguttaceae bacterium]